MLRKFSLLLCMAAILFSYSCQKSGNDPIEQPTDSEVDPAVDPPVNHSDSIFLLKRISTKTTEFTRTDFKYDEKHNLIKIDVKVNWTPDNGNFIFYKNGKVSHIVCQTDRKKFSVVLMYNSIGKCNAVFYKNVKEDLPNEDPYFTDLTDNNINYFDSLVYNITNQLEIIYEKSFNDTLGIVKFFYASGSSKAPEKMEKFVKSNGYWNLFDKLLLTTNDIDNPASHLVWYYPFLTKASGPPSGPNFPLPFLYNKPSTYMDFYLPLVPKCITHYKVFNDWGSHNYDNTYFKYEYSIDSLRLTSTQIGMTFPQQVYYDFEKVKR